VFLHAPEAEIVFLVIVEVIDMDDFEVIRLAVAVIITRERVARVWIEVKEKFGKRTGKPPQVIYLTRLQVFP